MKSNHCYRQIKTELNGRLLTEREISLHINGFNRKMFPISAKFDLNQHGIRISYMDLNRNKNDIKSL